MTAELGQADVTCQSITPEDIFVTAIPRGDGDVDAKWWRVTAQHLDQHHNAHVEIDDPQSRATFIEVFANELGLTLADLIWMDYEIVKAADGYLATLETTEQTAEQRAAELQTAVKTEGLVKVVSRLILEENHFAQDAGGKLYRYARGVYKIRGDDYIKQQVKRFCTALEADRQWSPRQADNVVEYIRVDSPVLWDKPPLDVINIKNGLLRLSDRRLLPHSPDLLTPVQLPVKYDPKATCPAIEQFVGEVFPPDAHTLAWELAAWLMRPDTSIQKAVLLTGAGGNGKSVFLRLLVSFVGKSNTCNLSLHKLESDRFAAARLLGKLANICADLPSEHLAGTSIFKAITGGDAISGEYKFRDSFDFVPFARLVFSANNPPRSQDSSQGFFDRWLVIPFDGSFRGTDAEIPGEVLDERLQAASEQSGLLNKALEVLARIEGKCGFSEPGSVQEAWREFHATTDPLAVWLDRYTIDDSESIVVRKSLRVDFNAYLEGHGRPALSAKAFGAAFGQLRPDVPSRQRTVNGKLQWCYVGIGLLRGLDDDSHGSQDSQDSPYINQSHGTDSDSSAEQSRENAVNPVNHVKGNTSPKDRTRCRSFRR